MTQIKSRFSGKVIHQGDFASIRECVEDAVKKGISLACVNLFFADLADADLSGADLSDADLKRANLIDANLTNANLTEACLAYADLTNTKMPAKPVALPPIGEAIIGFKKLAHDIVIKVEIPVDAQRVSTWKNRKCRASALRVLEVIRNPFGTPTDRMPGLHDPDFVYRLGKTHLPDRFDPDERHNCLPGLHFFMTFEEAAEW